jgi:hypothetical protein
MKSATIGIIVALLTLSPAALATDVNPDLIPGARYDVRAFGDRTFGGWDGF